MANRKKKPVIKTKPNRHTSPRIAFHLPESLLERLETYRSGLEPMPSESAVVRAALKRFLDAVAPKKGSEDEENE